MSAVTMHHFSGLAAPFVRSKGTVSGGVFENAGLDTPKMQCSICGKEKPAHAVYTLPEVWRHGRRLALYMLGKAPRPEPVDEEVMICKYGYTARDVFCVDCWLDLILDGTHKHGVSTDK